MGCLLSELTPCNYCSLQSIKRRAKESGKVVTTKAGGIGIKVFAHAQGEELKPWPDDGPPDGCNQVSEMMALTDYCCC